MYFPLIQYLFTISTLSTAIVIYTTCIINRFYIKNKIREKCKEAAKIIINDKNIKEVKVGIYDNNGTYIKEIKMTSEVGIADDIQKGSILHLY